MAIMFISAAAFIRQRPFMVLAPPFYHPNISSADLNLTVPKRERPNPLRFVTTNRLNPEPFRMYDDPHQVQRCSYTIEVMLDMFQKGVPFEIIEDKDLPEIFDGLDRYLLTLRTDVALGIPDSVEYAKLVVRWRAEVYKHYYRFMKLNPAAMEELYPNNNAETNIFTLMALISGISYDEMKTDPLRSRAKPPYEIASTIPKDKDVTIGNGSDPDGVLGFSQYDTPPAPDGKPFDFDSFVNGG